MGASAVAGTARSGEVPDGPDGAGIRADAASHLAYLSQLAGQLGVIDPVEAYFEPVAGRWSDLHEEAERWRAAARAAAHVSEELGKPLGGLDAGWEGKDADAFVAYIREIGVAGGDAEEALNTMADALDETAAGIRQIALDLADLLMDTAEVTSESATLPVGGEERARSQLVEARQSAKALFESARDVLESFGRLCDGVEDGDASTAPGIEMAHRYPEEKFKLEEDRSAAGPSSAPAREEAGESSSSASTSPAADHGSNDAAPGGSATTEAPLQVGHQTAAAPPAEAVAAAVTEPDAHANPGKGAQQAPMGGMVPMMGGMGAGQSGGDREHKVKARVPTEPVDLFGKPDQVAPPVIGKD
ncbi:WXG100 family type VII secretion target [Amycolatopsis anabasis]|uniref:WXG100 family type VII secretion target n=1 Tax=Amycolatopsis anabasis TaxID=1840409 RepID=UPI001FE3DEBF|nr:WXG100 family type VII secretion target [Amycolatopsis anabasis]